MFNIGTSESILPVMTILVLLVRVDVVRRELDLETGDARKRPRRRADLGGKVREGGQVIAERGRRIAELSTDELNAVTRIACKANRNGVESLLALFDGSGRRRGHGNSD